MRRRLFTTFALIVAMLSSMSLSAWADEEVDPTVPIDLGDGYVNKQGTGWNYDATSFTLTLTGYKFGNMYDSDGIIKNASPVEIDGKKAAVYYGGSAELTIKVMDNPDPEKMFDHELWSQEDGIGIYAPNASIKFTGENDAATLRLDGGAYGILAKGDITISSGKIMMDNRNHGLCSEEGNILFMGGKFFTDSYFTDVIKAAGSVIVDGGNVEAFKGATGSIVSAASFVFKKGYCEMGNEGHVEDDHIIFTTGGVFNSDCTVLNEADGIGSVEWKYDPVDPETIEIHNTATKLSKDYGYVEFEKKDPVSYVYYTFDGATATKHTDGIRTKYNVMSKSSYLSGGWYVVNSDVTIANRINLDGEVNIILCDGKTLTASKGITVREGSTLNIYAQSAGSGALFAGTTDGTDMTCDDNGAGIGGGIFYGYYEGGGTVIIHGGNVTAYGSDGSMGIGKGKEGSSDGILTFGTGLKVFVSDDNDTWTEYDGSTRARYMKVGTFHAHDFAYEKTAENVITATCSNTDGCSLAANDFKATLTIGMPTTEDGKAVLTQNPANVFGKLNGEVLYQTKKGGSWDEATNTPRTANGIHKASFTIDGKTISVAYGTNCISYATEIANGSITGPNSATVGAAVMPTITPEKGYELDALTVTPEEGSGVAAVALTEDGNGFIMPEANLTVSASFKKTDYAIRTSAQHGTVTFKKGGAAVTSANYQDNITLTFTPDEGYELTSFTLTDIDGKAVTVAEEAFVMPDGVVVATATFTAVEYTVGVAQTSNGTVTASKATATIGNEIALTVTPADGYQLTALTVTKENGGTVNVTDGKFNMPAANVTIAATFSEIVYTVTVNDVVATVTDNTPQQNTYTATFVVSDKDYDGVMSVAIVKRSKEFPIDKVPISKVTYKDSDGNVVAKAENVGTYTATVTIGDKVITKSFSIKGLRPIVFSYYECVNGRGYWTHVKTGQYILIKDNPYGITVLDEGKYYVVDGEITVGELIYRGDVKVVQMENAKLWVVSGVHHIGSSLSLYVEDGGDNAVMSVTGKVSSSTLEPNEALAGENIAGVGSSLSGDIRVYGGTLTLSKGVNAKLVDDDIKFTVGRGVNAIVTTEAGSAPMEGGTVNEDGSVTYTSAEFANVLSLQTELTALIDAAPTANTDLIYDGVPVELITEGEAIGGTMQYAFGNDANTVPAEGWSDSAPTATEAKTYYVWYMAKGDENHKDSEAGCVTATVAISANQAAADAVIAVFDALPAQITLTDETAIAAARAAYDALTDAQKAKVPAEILAKLTAAEAALAAAMTTTGIEGIAADAVESNIWYDLNGRRLDGKPTKTGIYINNHKKVYVK